MEIDFVKSIAVGLCASIPLGPIGVLCVQRTINNGRLSGFVSGMGAAFADTVFAIFAIFGLSMVEAIIQEQEKYFLILGGGILAYLGYHIFSTNPIKQIRRAAKEKERYIERFASTFLLTLSNPGAIFLLLGLFTFFKVELSASDAYSNIVSGVLGVLLGASIWWFFLTSVVSHFRKLFRLRQLITINYVTGIIICILGLFSVVQGLLIN